MRTDRTKAVLQDYADGGLSPQESARVEAALADVAELERAPCPCDKCRDCLAATSAERLERELDDWRERAYQSMRAAQKLERDYERHVVASRIDRAAREELERALEQKDEWLRLIQSELGVPGEDYPAPIANAYKIARVALAASAEPERTEA